MDFEKEQIELLKTIEENSKPPERVWNRYNGDVCCRVVQEHIQRHVPNSYKVTGPNAYIEDIPTEFDLLIVDSSVWPKTFTNAYPSNSVHCVIEIKKHGIFSRNEPNLYRDLFDSIVGRHPHINCMYLTIQEVGKTKRPSSISYLELMQQALEPKFKACTLKQSRGGEIIQGEWRRFINSLQDALSSNDNGI